METDTVHCDLRDNLARVRTTIGTASHQSGRDPQTVTLVAASKTVEPDRLQSTIDLGHRVFGENRVQEAKNKWPPLLEGNRGLELHLLGPLQSNKARDAVALFDVIQSIDRPSIATAIARESDKQGRRPQVYIQVNTAREPQKSGVLPEEASEFIRACRETLDLDLAGLMCIPPAGEDPSGDFALLRKISEDEGLRVLSMGMSGDYAQAIGQGATHVRVGSAIFGARPPVRS
ncbi:YggS family pyridoxal phosphate-dependent enzyme [Roseibium marinum]|uniref:Pyridoxal phosphate homeostasis protein n=1 Tax=Roseibium marinum TaxID=281252 RepID=A0A2S3V1A0_9HYPH|nr:YggS family pyridoxal phosphate-dependent enzyme [Roseibium marinum]POF33640.1 hypothetical protein CLV41_10189 [Roseibium marinum]